MTIPSSTSSETVGSEMNSERMDLTHRDFHTQADSEWVSRQVRFMESAWEQGRKITAIELLSHRPNLGAEHAIRLVYEEICLRREDGQQVITTEILNQFPQWKNDLKVLLDCDRLLRPLTKVTILPKLGDLLGPFRLVSELGRGASGKTYLAVEPGLADRLVVLKVMPDDQEEHLSLARLQHTHIIPLFAEHAFPDQGLRALCMPYLGGASLARVLEGLGGYPFSQLSGRRLLEVLDQAQAGPPAPQSADGPYRRFLDQASYVQSICWIGACLADGLHDAHLHGLIHMDVKPSNVLIAGDGLPMLLDFHLARKSIQIGELISDRVGGTPGCMAPEQRDALAAVSLGRPVPNSVDHRCDIYALGVLLHDALSRDAISNEPTSRSYRRPPPQVSVGLADLIDKCLNPNPKDRYKDAASLADDLRRHLNDLPLRGVVNRSIGERWRKWRRRRPGALTRGAAWSLMLAASIATLGLGYTVYRQKVHQLEMSLEDGQRFQLEHRFAEAAHSLDRGLQRASQFPGVDRLRQELAKQLRLAKRAQKADDLNHLADVIRFRYGISPPSGEEAQTLTKHIRLIWEERNLLLETGPESPVSEITQQIRTDLLDLAVVWANLRVRMAPTGKLDEARQEALQVLNEAESACGTSLALSRERRSYTHALGLIDSHPELELSPQTPWEHYNLGQFYLRSGLTQKAAREFQLSLDSRPQDFWPNFYQGLCAYNLGRFQEAIAAFRTCVALSPTTAECFYNRALANDATGETAQALHDYSMALNINPQLTSAALNRGILFYKAGRYQDAVKDLQRALQLTTDRVILGRIHFNLALTHLARGDRSSALINAKQAQIHGVEEANELSNRLLR
jgi:eukaryotic-like serine/threonine-protein kinase